MCIDNWLDEVLEYFDEVGMEEIEREIKERRDYILSLGGEIAENYKENVDFFKEVIE